MTEDRLRFISNYLIPTKNSDRHNLIVELVKEIKRARQSERIAKAAAQIYRKRLEPVKLIKRKAA